MPTRFCFALNTFQNDSSLLFAFGHLDFDIGFEMFGRATQIRIDDVANRFTMLENVVGINLPRIATLENRTNDMDKKISSADRRLDRLMQRRNMLEDFNEHESWLGSLGPAAGAQIPEAKAPNDEQENPFAMPLFSPSLTASQADGAPLFTEDAGNL